MERTYNTNSRVVYLYTLLWHRAETRFTEAGSNPAIPFATSRDDEDFMDDLLRSMTYSRIGSSADSAKKDEFQQECLLKPGVCVGRCALPEKHTDDWKHVANRDSKLKLRLLHLTLFHQQKIFPDEFIPTFLWILVAFGVLKIRNIMTPILSWMRVTFARLVLVCIYSLAVDEVAIGYRFDASFVQ